MNEAKKRIAINTGLVSISIIVSICLIEAFLAVRRYPVHFMPFVRQPYLSRTFHSREFSFRMHTNRDGIRYENIPYTKPAGTRRVLVLGDSFVEGSGVDDDKSFCHLLEHRHFEHSRTRFINAGKGGSGPFRYGRILYSIGLKYDPDAVLVCLYANDITNTPPGQRPRDMHRPPPRPASVLYRLWPRIGVLYEWMRYNIRRKGHRDSGDFIQRVTQRAMKAGISTERIAGWKECLKPAIRTALDEHLFYPDFLANGLLAPYYWAYAIDLNNDRALESWRTMGKIILHIVSTCRRRGIETALVYIPSPLQYDPGHGHMYGTHYYKKLGYVIRDEWLDRETAIQKTLRWFAVSQEIAFVDLTPILRAENRRGTKLNYTIDGHLNEAGHSFVARVIARWLTESGVFSFL